jgi:EpsI family protein
VTTAVALAVACAVFLACYFDVLRLLAWQWRSNDVYSYGFLIPVISAYLVWTKRHAVRAALGRPSYRTGVPTLVLGLAMLVAGRAGSLSLLEEFSMVVTLAGIVLLGGGVRVARALWLPLVYLLSALPMWDVFTDPLHAPFQLLAARIGEVLLHVARVPVFRTGILLQLPTVTLEVARACSGVNYLISIVAVAVPYAYLSMSGSVRRITVVALAVLVAILSNGVRVAFIGALQYYGFSAHADLHGPNHVLQGMFVAVVGYIALFAGAWMLEDRSGLKPAGAGGALQGEQNPRRRQPWQPLIVVAGILAVGALLRPVSEPAPVALAGINALPDAIGRWVSATGQAERSAMRAGRPDVELSREYYSDGGLIEVYIGYFASQRDGRKLVGYGGADLPESATRVSIAGPALERVYVAEAEVERPGGGSRYVVAWYDLNGRVVTNEYVVKLLTVWNAVFHRRSNGAVVVLTLDASPSADTQHARTVLRGFAADVVPVTRRCLATAW